MDYYPFQEHMDRVNSLLASYNGNSRKAVQMSQITLFHSLDYQEILEDKPYDSLYVR